MDCSKIHFQINIGKAFW